MRKTVLLPASFLIFLSAGRLAHTPSGFPGKALEQDQPERPKSYALQVVCEKQVQNGKDSLHPPDGQFAEILPSGQLIMLMENILFPSPIIGNGETAGGLDTGSLVGKGETDFGLEG